MVGSSWSGYAHHSCGSYRHYCLSINYYARALLNTMHWSSFEFEFVFFHAPFSITTASTSQNIQMHHSRKDSDLDSDDFIVAVRREHNHHCPIESLYSAHSPQSTLLKTVMDPKDVKRFLRGYHFSYQTTGKQGKINVCRCNLHTKCEHCIKIEHCSDDINVLKRGKHSQTLNKPKAGIYDIIKEEVDMIIRGAPLPNYKLVTFTKARCIPEQERDAQDVEM